MINDGILLRSAKSMNSRVGRYLMMAFGWLYIAVGLVSIVVPGLPTTGFLLIAAWRSPDLRIGFSAGCSSTRIWNRRSSRGAIAAPSR
jgi:hypothetical protein